EYDNKVQAAAQKAGVVLAGYQQGVVLAQLYTHAGAFVLPSSHEGLPIALLEALTYGLPVLASAIPANLAVTLPDSSYFPVGDVKGLAAKLLALSKMPVDEAARESRRRWVTEQYDWGRIARQTYAVYDRVVREPKPLSRSVM